MSPDLEYYKHSAFKRFLISLGLFFKGIGIGVLNFIKGLGPKILNIFKNIGLFFKNIGVNFAKGSIFTKISYFIMGFGSFCRKQIIRGFVFLTAQVSFIVYMIMVGGPNIKLLNSLGEVETHVTEREVEVIPGFVQTVDETVYGDNSFMILLWSVLSIFFIAALLYTWYINIKQNWTNDQIIASGKKIKSNKDDLHSVIDDQFHKTLLALPVLGITVFTIMPTIFMILIAFTNYDKNHTPPNKLFTWVGLDNLSNVLNWSNGSANFSATFGEILVWTLIWAFFATFTNYFLGMIVAMMINKKGIKLKKLWRTILVATIAIPQFISLLFVSKMFEDYGIVNSLLQEWGWIKEPLPFWTDKNWARIMVILINIWIGIPYLMLITTGVLMNIPADLYESARIDGANKFQQYFKITLPYMLFVTGPYLLTSFTSNMNNFNVIYLLTAGRPSDIKLAGGGGTAGYTDLLITWLYKLTVDDSNYRMAAVIGILVFLFVAVISLIVYNLIPSTKNEEDFQ